MNTPLFDFNLVARPKDILQALIGLCIGYSVAAFLHFGKGHSVVAIIIVCIASTIAICTLFIPPAHHAIQKFFAQLANWVGRILAYIMLFPLFYLFFVPAGFMRKLRGKDPLQLRKTENKPTYWEPRKQVNLDQYRRQF